MLLFFERNISIYRSPEALIQVKEGLFEEA